MREKIITTSADLVDDISELSVRYVVRGGAMLKLRLDTPRGYPEPRVREIVLAEPEAEAVVRGAFVGHHEDSLDLQLDTIHAAPRTTGRTDFRAVLDGKSVLKFRGMIKIAPGAQGSDDFLRQDSLILSETAKADSVPGLEIEANDVKASHGATAKPIDQEQLFYFMSRGVDAKTATSELVTAFLRPIVQV